MSGPSPRKPYESNSSSATMTTMIEELKGEEDGNGQSISGNSNVNSNNMQNSSLNGMNNNITGYGSGYGTGGFGSGYGNTYGTGYGGGYSGYGGGGYGGGYGSYGGGYGGYGGGYGGYGGGYGGYGGGYGGYGGGYGGMMGPNGPDGMNPMLKDGYALINNMENSVQSFGRISELLHMNFEALHMSFSSMVRLVTNVLLLKQEMWGAFKSITTFGFLQAAFFKIKYLIKKYIFRKKVESVEMHEAWREESNGLMWIPTAIALFIIWKIIKWIWNSLNPERTNEKAQAPFNNVNNSQIDSSHHAGPQMGNSQDNPQVVNQIGSHYGFSSMPLNPYRR